MSKLAETYTLTFAPRGERDQAYRWLYSAVRDQILQGYLRPGTKLPATRDLSKQCGLSRGTVVRAFEELQAEGYIESTVGSGTFVSSQIPDDVLNVRDRIKTGKPSVRAIPKLSKYANRVEFLPNLESRPSRTFRANIPAVDLFPVEIWGRLAARVMQRTTANQLLVCEPLGYPPLREAIADYLSVSRGTNCTPEQVAVVGGIQEALDLTVRLFIDAGDRVCIEDPGYPGALALFRAAEAEIVPLPVDEQGVRIDESAMRHARLIYVTPGHQFPIGVTMSLSRRLHLLDWAHRTGAVIFEDDYDSEYRYSGSPVPCLHGMDHGSSVLLGGSFSKVLYPSLRLGYLVFPSPLAERVAAIISTARRHTPILDQLILHRFIVEGHFARHLRRMRQTYSERLSALQEAASKEWGSLANILGAEAGLQTSVRLHGGIEAEAFSKAAAIKGVEVTPVDRYSQLFKNPDIFQLGFAAFDAKEIHRGVCNLAEVLRSFQPRKSSRTSGSTSIVNPLR